jgi:hypothetical protein
LHAIEAPRLVIIRLDLLTIDGVAQVLLLNGAGAIGVAPADGTVL